MIQGEAFRQSVDGFVKLHRLIAAGQGESPEADAIRDSLDAPWYKMTKEEQETLGLLSEDLYSISDRDPNRKTRPSNPQSEDRLADVSKAMKNEDWDLALSTLRRWKDYLPEAVLAGIRGAAYWQLGYSQVAMFFFEAASQIDPADPRHFASYLSLLELTDINAAIVLARSVLKAEEHNSPLIVMRSAGIVFSSLGHHSKDEAVRECKRLVALLKRTRDRMSNETIGDLAFWQRTREQTTFLLCACLINSEDKVQALELLDTGLSDSPNNMLLLMLRGMVNYDRDPNVVHDFERLLVDNPGMIWPYFFLAHHYLHSRNFEQCIKTCDVGIRLAETGRLRSRFLEWKGIAQSELNLPFTDVHQSFSEALRCDPANESALENISRLQESNSVDTSAKVSWLFLNKSDITRIALAEAMPGQLREQRWLEMHHPIVA